MYKISPLNLSTIKYYKSCFEKNGNPKSNEKIQWQFIDNPINKSFVDIAYDEENNQTAAIYATSCVRFKLEATSIIGTQSLDTITDLEYRGKGLFITLAKSVYAKAKEAGVSFVYGFPNGNSIHGFNKKLDWEVLDPLPFLIKPLRTKYFTNKIKLLKFLPNFNIPVISKLNNKNFDLEEKNSFPKDVTLLWENFSKNIEVAVIRDKTYLDWRYINKPNETYQIVHCYSKDKAYLGFLVYTIKNKHDGRIAYIMELIYNLEYPKVGSALLNFAVDKIKNEKCDCILSWCMSHSPNFKTYKKSFFITMPERIRPIELHFGVRSFQEYLKPIINNRKNWFISYSDSDTV